MHPLIAAHWTQVEDWLDALLELPAEQHEPWLAERCPDPQLRAAVLALLAGEAAGAAALGQLRHQLDGSGGLEGQQLGPYKIVRLIGEGGMASVFEAERRTSEFTQRVAVKLMRVGLYSAEQSELFRREQKIHAALEHPNIARVLDSGVTAAGVPYFVIELIEGSTILEHADARRLDIEARLRLFAKVCDAVQFAHQNLVVHRDLKPSNILVSFAGEPKLLDFGIAKLLAASGEESTATATEYRRLTPAYAAPEQASGGAITTATDVYALGVVLAELLAGARPERGPDGVAERPSRVAERRPRATADARRLGARALARRLRGDLDSVVVRALSVDPRRRYPSAAALRDDLFGHLAGRPIAAQPGHALYRARKFAWRHRLGLAAVAAVVATLAGASAFSLQQAQHAREQAARAEAEAQRALAVRNFLAGLFYQSVPGADSGAQTADQMLARAREKLLRDFADKPEIAVELLGAIGDVERRRSHLQAARPSLEQSLALAQQHFGAADARTLRAHLMLSRLDATEGQFGPAAERLGGAFEAFRHAGLHHDGIEAEVLDELGNLYMRLGQDQNALASTQQAVAIMRRIGDSGAMTLADSLTALGDALFKVGRSMEALAAFEEALGLHRAVNGPVHTQVATDHGMLAMVQRELGRYSAAEAQLRQAVAIERKVHSGPDSNFASSLNDLALTLTAEGHTAEAEALFVEALAMQRALLGPEHPYIAVTLGNLGVLHLRQERFEESARVQWQALEMVRKTRGPDHPRAARAEVALARALIRLARYDEAAALIDPALARDRKRYGEAHRDVAADLMARAELGLARNDAAAALDDARAALAILAALPPPGHPRTLEARNLVVRSLDAGGDETRARSESAALLGLARADPFVPAVVVAEALRVRAGIERKSGHPQAARDHLTQALAALRKDPQVDTPLVPAVQRELDALPR